MFKLYLLILVLQLANGNPTTLRATQQESPWLVHITVKQKVCGGVLIADKHVLTAAHCFDQLKTSELTKLEKLREVLKIRIGEWKTNTDPDCGDKSEESCDPTADVFPKNITIYDDYKKNDVTKSKNDIAIIELGWMPRRSELINVVHLSISSRCDVNVTGEHWNTTGFGLSPGNDRYSEIKKSNELIMISQQECNKSMDHKLFHKFDQKIHVCAVPFKGGKLCKGDDGSAVTNVVEGVTYLQGIVSFTYNEDECNQEKNLASMLLRVSCFYDWIHSKIPNLAESFTHKPEVKESKIDDDFDRNLNTYYVDASTKAPVFGTTFTPEPSTNSPIDGKIATKKSFDDKIVEEVQDTNTTETDEVIVITTPIVLITKTVVPDEDILTESFTSEANDSKETSSTTQSHLIKSTIAYSTEAPSKLHPKSSDNIIFRDEDDEKINNVFTTTAEKYDSYDVTDINEYMRNGDVEY